MCSQSKSKTRDSSPSITVLLPYYMIDCFRLLFEDMGFSVIHSENRGLLQKAIRAAHIDIALEWQHDREDYPIRDLLRKYNKRVPILLCLNWNGRLPRDFPSIGYEDYLNVPWTIDELMSKCYKALPEDKKPILKAIWRRNKE